MRTIATLLFAASFAASHAQWQLATPIKLNSEFEDMVMVGPQVGYATDWVNGAILSTHDGGATWDRRQHLLFNDPRAIHMWDEERGIVVCNGGYAYRTTDGFRTMNGSGDSSYGSMNCVFFVNDTLGWVGTQSGKIYRSTDAGVSWTLMASGQSNSNYITSIFFVDTEIGYASCYGGDKVLKSIDGGLTWTGIAPEELVFIRDIHFSDALTGIAVGHAGHILRTTDGGASWNFMNSTITNNLLSLSVQGDHMVACGWNGRVVHSTDGGLTWSAQFFGPEHMSVSIAPNGHGLMGSIGKIYRTEDFGATWELYQQGTTSAMINKISFANSDTGVVANTLRTVDGGRSWAAAPGGGLGVHLRADGVGSRGGGSGSFGRTLDYFTTGISGTGPDMAIRCTWSLSATTHIVGGGHVNGGIYRTINNGANWTRVLDLGNIIINDLWFVNDLLGFAVGEDGNSHRTMDGGLTWENMGGNGGHTVFFFDELHGWTANALTVDGGDTWTYMGGTSQSTRSIFFTSLDTGYAVSSTGQVEHSIDGGIAWDNVLPPITNAFIYDATFVDGWIVMAGEYGDIYRAQVSCPQHDAPPEVVIAGQTLCTVVGEGQTAQWYQDDQPINGGDTPCIEAEEVGVYHVIVTDAMGCVSLPSMDVHLVGTGIVDASTATTRLVPNPAHDQVRIDRTNNGPATLTLLDAHGRIAHTERMTTTNTILDVHALPAGTYIICIVGTDAVEALRFVRE